LDCNYLSKLGLEQLTYKYPSHRKTLWQFGSNIVADTLHRRIALNLFISSYLSDLHIMTWLSNFREKRRSSRAVNEHSTSTFPPPFPLLVVLIPRKVVPPTSTPHTYLPLTSESPVQHTSAAPTSEEPELPQKPHLIHIPTDIITATEKGMMSGSSMSRYTGFDTAASSSGVPSSTTSTASSNMSQKLGEEGKDEGAAMARVMTRGEEACGDEDRVPGGRRASGRSVLFKGVDV
jgi:hypothetical protein